jgi:hypothetical protein
MVIQAVCLKVIKFYLTHDTSLFFTERPEFLVSISYLCTYNQNFILLRPNLKSLNNDIWKMYL